MVNFILGGLILFALFLALRKTIKDISSGGCGGGCSGCPSANACSSVKEAGTKA